MRRARTAGLALLLPALLSLTACKLFQEQGSALTVSPGSVSLNATTSSTSVTLTNTSATSVSWTASTSDTQHVSLSQISGVLAAGASQSVTVYATYYGLSQGQTISPTVTFSGGTAGNAVLTVNFTMTIGGLAQCGTLPSTASQPTAARPAPARAMLPDGRSYVPHELLVAYTGGPGAQAAGSAVPALAATGAAVRSDYGLKLLRAGGIGAPDLVRVQDARAAQARLQSDPRVLYAELNVYLKPMATNPGDAYFSDEWNMSEFGMEQAWDTEKGGSNPTVIAVVDTGVQLDHPDLQGKIIGGCDFQAGDNDPSSGPGVDHGTHVAGIAGAIGGNGIGVAGVAYALNAKIEPVKIFDASGNYATLSALVNGILWAAGVHIDGVADNPNPADVINMSVGVDGNYKSVNDAAATAFGNGSLLVAAAGNHDPGVTDPSLTSVTSPGNAYYVIAVGSVDSDYAASEFSNYDSSLQQRSDFSGVELMAPGGLEASGAFTSNLCFPAVTIGNTTGYEIPSTYTGSSYGCESGTSMATPFVAGIAALLRSQSPGRTPTQLRSILDAAVKPGSAPDPTVYGYGVVCADVAVNPSSTTVCGQ